MNQYDSWNSCTTYRKFEKDMGDNKAHDILDSRLVKLIKFNKPSFIFIEEKNYWKWFQKFEKWRQCRCIYKPKRKKLDKTKKIKIKLMISTDYLMIN